MVPIGPMGLGDRFGVGGAKLLRDAFEARSVIPGALAGDCLPDEARSVIPGPLAGDCLPDEARSVMPGPLGVRGSATDARSVGV